MEKDQASDALRMCPISFFIEQLIEIIRLTSANTGLVCRTGELKAHTVYDSLKGLTAEIDWLERCQIRKYVKEVTIGPPF